MIDTKQDFSVYKRKDCYIAGLPSYPRNFSRDALIAGLISEDGDLLLSQLKMSAIHQGAKYDPVTGEEPGKIHHEYPGVLIREPYLSTYNACDTTALFLIATEKLLEIDQVRAKRFIAENAVAIEKAILYIRDHTSDGIFWEYPPKGALGYSLKVTYWKDSIIPCSSGKQEPDYPVSYALAQFIAANGIASGGRIINRPDLTELADEMYRKGIDKFMHDDYFCVFQDKTDKYKQESSDELHCLAYIPTKYSSYLPMKSIRNRAKTLYTPAGIACTPQHIADGLEAAYHGYVVWPFEQALIHNGCIKFGLLDIAEVAALCVPYINHGQELLQISPAIKPSGNDRQLWSVAAKIYFSKLLA